MLRHFAVLLKYPGLTASNVLPSIRAGHVHILPKWTLPDATMEQVGSPLALSMYHVPKYRQSNYVVVLFSTMCQHMNVHIHLDDLAMIQNTNFCMKSSISCVMMIVW